MLVDEEARKANGQAEEAAVIKADCEKDLEAAMPALEAVRSRFQSNPLHFGSTEGRGKSASVRGLDYATSDTLEYTTNSGKHP